MSVPWKDEPIPVLGYGTSALMGGGRAAAASLLEAAYATGIRHFDTAAYYGMGEAEEVVGNFLATRRSEVTVTTKGGIQPPRGTSSLRFAVTTGRRVARALPITKAMFHRATSQMIRASAFAPTDIVASLDRSLKALQTDYIDCFLLHDYSLRNSRSDELVEVLQAAVRAGKVRSFGVGAPFLDLIEVIRGEPRLAGVVQFENSAVRRNLDHLQQQSVQFRITHGSLSESFGLVRSYLQGDPASSRRWSESLGCNVADPGTLSSLMLDYSVRANVGGLVLFSSTNPQRIAANARAIFDTSVGPDTASAFAELVATEIGGAEA